MRLSIGIVGLPNVGKSTLFKALTNQDINIANYPFATIDPNVGIVPVPDERLEKLTKLSNSKKTIPAVVEFNDIAGLVKGASKGEGLGNQFLTHIRETQAIVIVLRAFNDSNIIHVENSVDPIRDLETINTELIFKDLEVVDKRLSSLEKETRAGDKEAIKTLAELEEIKKYLESGKLPISSLDLNSLIRENKRIAELNLLTAKKQIYLINGSEDDASDALKNKIKELSADFLIQDLSQNSNLNELIKKAYQVLGLISFLTTGEDETRAWTIQNGMKAPEAAGVIHTDFEKKFIRAEVINWQKLLEASSWSKAREKGLIRLEGKEYVIQDGDVIVVRHG